MLAPDFAFTRRQRLTSEQPERAYLTVIPDFVVEVLSPCERAGHISTKLRLYLEAGVRLIWIVNPTARTVEVHAAGAAVRFFGQLDTLDGGDLLPGFSLAVSELFRY